MWGDSGRSDLPTSTATPAASLERAIGDLAQMVQSGSTRHPCDVVFGQSVVAVFAAVERSIARAGASCLVAPAI